ncbi:MAG: hypothetical protein PF447_13520 [Spirochaetaceae bacterium]|nr:hypothetical protein [Spirochaetaceae bacterium]
MNQRCFINNSLNLSLQLLMSLLLGLNAIAPAGDIRGLLVKK